MGRAVVRLGGHCKAGQRVGGGQRRSPPHVPRSPAAPWAVPRGADPRPAAAPRWVLWCQRLESPGRVLEVRGVGLGLVLRCFPPVPGQSEQLRLG